MPATLSKPKKAKQGKPVVDPVVAPMLGETQAAFFDRAMRALKGQIPSVNRRTVEVIKIWKQSPNDHDLREKAALLFPAEKFKAYGPRCIFIEHKVPAGPDGSTPAINYNQVAMQHLVNWGNYRVRDKDMFSVISDGHTPTSEQVDTGRQFPDALGYAGPFYLGLLGDVDPKWAVYADEYVHLEDVARFEKLQRRSPEVWCNEPMERRTMDPIAAIGAETPVLDSGMNPYSRAGDGVVVMRYSAMAFAGAANAYVPGATGDKSNKKYGAHQMPLPNQSGGNSQPDSAAQQDDQPDLATALMGALQDLFPALMQNVQQRLGGDPAAGGDQMPPDNGDGSDVSAADTSAQGGDALRGQSQQPAPPTGQATPAAGAGASATTQQPPQQQPADGMDEDERRQYSAMNPECQTAYMTGRKKGASMSKPQQYGRGANPGTEGSEGDLHAVVAQQQVEINRLRDTIEQRDRDRARYSRLSDLSKDYSFEIDDEMETVLDMSDDQFTRHCEKTVTKYSRRNDPTNVEFFDDPDLQPERYGRGANGGPSRADEAKIARYSREAADSAAQKNFSQPGSTSYQAEYEAILKKNGVTA